MKSIKLTILVLVVAMLSACTTETEFGRCIGVADDKDPALVYKLSVLNTVLASIFVATIFVPVIVLVDETFCPVGKK